MRFILLFILIFITDISFGASIWPNGTRLQTFQNGFLFGNGQTIDSAASGFTFDNAAQFNGPFTLEQSATPSNPSAGFNKLYFKSDENLYKLDSAGNELAVGELNIAGQNQSNIAVTEVEAPNNQVTQTGASKALIETGNLNLLSNSGFEHSTFDTSWVTTGTTGTMSAELSSLISGAKAFKVITSAQNISLVQDSTLYAAQLAGMQGYVQMSCSNTAPNVKICARGAGATSTSDCVTLATDGAWKQYEIPVVLSATSNGLSIAATSTTGTTICDDAYVGLIGGKTPEVSQAQLAGESYFAGTTNCASWTRTSTTLGAVAADADCPGPTIVEQNIGEWQTTDSNLPRQTINNLPAGKYKATFILPSTVSGTASVMLAIYDGSSSCYPSETSPDTSRTINTISCSFSYTSPGNRSFEIYTASSASTVTIPNERTSPAGGVKFILEYYPPASKIYSQQCRNEWDCENVFSAQILANAAVNNVSMPGWLTCTTNTVTLTCTYNAALAAVLTSPMVCTGSKAGSSGGSSILITAIGSTTGFTATATNMSTNPTHIHCVKSSPDFKEKNVITGTFAEMMKVPGVSKPIEFGFAGNAICTTGNCPGFFWGDTIGSGNVAFSSTGVYALTIPSGKCASIPICSAHNRAYNSASFRCIASYYTTTTGTAYCHNNFDQPANEAPQFVCKCQAP